MISSEPSSLAKDRNIETICALSPLQEGLLFHALLDPESAVYFEQVSCRLGGLRSPRHFERAWQMAVDRHAALRTGFYWKNRKRPLQIVKKQCDLPWLEEDWRSFNADAQQARLESLLEADRKRGFDLAKAPLMRCTLLRLTDQDYRFVWSHHHLILDGWSASLVVKEVFESYEALCAGGDGRLRAPRPFREYIGWLGKRDSAADETFWRANLAGFSQQTRLGSPARMRAIGQAEVDYEEREVRVSEAVTTALQDLARQHRLTMNCLVQAAWALLLSRAGGERDVLFGSTVSGRPPELPGVESTVGVFINALPVRVSVPSDASVLAWLGQLMAQQVEREQHAYSSLVDIQAWSEIRPGEPLFESLLIFENYPLRDSHAGHVAIDDVHLFRRANFPLTLVVAPDAELHLAISYDPVRFEAETIERMLGWLRLILEQFAEAPERQLREITLLTEAERDMVAQWNSTEAPYPNDRAIHEIFGDWVRRTPDAIALRMGQESLSYRALNARANQLAHELRDRGVGPETLVGISIERSLEMVVAVLGVLKAGGAYLPLDPTYPADRLAFMIEDSGVPLIVTQQRLEERIPSSWAQIIAIDDAWPDIAAQPENAIETGVDADNLAYVIYTSGSTGRPKGVQVTHRGLCNLAEAQRSLFAPLPGGHVLQFASLSFDASAWEMAMALGNGAALHLGTSESLLPGAALERELERGGITHVTLPPSALEMLSGELPSLHTLIVAGEACAPELVNRWASGRRFVNAYGPTESTVCGTAWVCGDERKTPPIGRPLPNTRACPLDREGNPAPVGIAGELYLGGVHLARGYLQRPGLTAERFVPDPLSGEPGARLYNTGDLARYRADGALVFLGRADGQVKIRGHRIELGEIEAALAAAPGVRQCVVAARPDASGAASLVAYVVGGEAAGMRNFLRERLPEYMIPGQFVALDALPLSPSGKVDRQALPAPDSGSRGSGTRAFQPARDVLEQKLVKIWEEVLDVHPVGVEDDFFLLGGHSLLAVRLMACIEQELGQHLPMAALFRSPTIAQLAMSLRRQEDSPVWSSLVPVQSSGSHRPLFFVPGGGGNVVYLHALAQRLGRARPFYGLQARGLDGQSEPHGSIEEMATAYLDEIRAVQSQGPYLLGGHSSGSWVAFEMARQLQNRGESVAMVVVVDTPAPISGTKTEDVDDDDALYLTKVARLIERWADKDLDISYEALHPLSDADRMDYLEGRLKSVGILPPEAGRAQVHGLVQVFRASTRNCVRYVARGTYPGRVTLLRAREIHVEDTGIRMNLHSHDKTSEKDTWGWSALAETGVDVRIVPGDHVTMMAEPHVGELARELAACIEQAEEVPLTRGAGA